ncbi:chemotaxis protein, partial [Acidiphilium multivorum]|nr:chemotaxis protein [Acidiphilium multivorum]
AMVEQTSAATHSLREEISRLAGRVSGFRTAHAAPAYAATAYAAPAHAAPTASAPIAPARTPPRRARRVAEPA